MKKNVLWLLCALMLLTPVLSACTGDGDETEQTVQASDNGGETNTENVGEDVSYLYYDKQMNYRIVYSASASTDVTTSVDSLGSTLARYVGASDFYGSDAAIKREEGTPEIIVGDTSRSESAQLKAEITGMSYRIKTINENIVIVAAKEWMLPDAFDEVVKKIEYAKDRKSATIATDFDVTYTYDGYTRDRWSNGFPAYHEGVLSSGAFSSNYGLESMRGTSPSTYSVVCASGTNETELDEYIEVLEKEGYEVKSVKDSEDIVSYWVSKSGKKMYMYHSVNAGEIRFVLDTNESVSASEASYTYNKQDGDTTEFYAYGLSMSSTGKEVYMTDAKDVLKKINCGQLLIFKLADNSVMLIDGGSNIQMPKEAAVELDRFLRDITDTPTGEKVTVANWLITHPHDDHFSGMARFLYNYHDNYDFKRVTFNFDFIDKRMPDFFNNNFNVWYPDAVFCRPHTGETLKIADITIDILYTYEDSISAKTGSLTLDEAPLSWGGKPVVDQNNSSITAKITFDGKTFLLTGDINLVAQDVLLRNYGADVLKCDILQVSHHGINHLPKLYSVVKPSVSVYSQKRVSAPLVNSGTTAKILANVIANTEGGEANVYFHGDCTAKLTVVDGSIVGERLPIVDVDGDGQEMLYTFPQ